MKFTRKLSIVLLGGWLAGLAQNGYGHGHDECEKLLTDPHIVLSSGRDVGYEKEFKEAADTLFTRGGVVERLGLANPPQIHELVPSSQLNVLAALGRHAIPHWHDGMAIAQAAKTAGGVLEFVTPGMPTAPLCPVCRAFYSDTTSQEHQLSVLMHVVGHNDFAAHSMYCTSRPCDPIQESLELSDFVARLYEDYDHDEVSRWYQWLLSLSQLQDLTNGTFEAPESFDPSITAEAGAKRVVHAGSSSASPYASKTHPRSPTPSVLQAIVANLSSTMPEWKKEMARRFEKMERVIGFYYSNKIMNEGWATLMQELLPRYTKYSDSHHSIEFAQLMQGVAFPSLSNPYFLGRECWRIVRRKFNARPEIRGLSIEEQDRRFIDYAHSDIISWMNDYQFIRFALDDQWVFENKLRLSRRAEQQEQNPNLPPPKKQNQEQKIILSKDATRVINYIARKLADHSLKVPQIWLHDFKGFGRGVTDYRHHVVEGIPLRPQTAGQTLFVMAQATESTVSLTTVWWTGWGHDPRAKRPPAHEPEDPDYVVYRGRPQPAPAKPESVPIRIEVEPSGKVRVFAFDGEKDTDEYPQLAAVYQKPIESYIGETEGLVNEGLAIRDQQKYRTMVSTSVDSHTLPATQMFSHSPTAGHALLELAGMLERGITRAIQNALKGNSPIKRTAKGVRIKVLPDIPSFELDHGAAQKIASGKPPAPPDTQLATMSIVRQNGPVGLPAVQIGEDDGSDLGGGEGEAGDKFWGDKPGQGKGKGDPDDGDPEDGDDDGDGDQGEPKDPTEVEIPAELFTKFLIEDFKLPNMRKKSSSGDNSLEEQYEGAIHRPQGRILWERTVPAALNYAIEMRRRKGLPFRGVPQIVLLKEGLKYLQRTDYVVADRQPVPEPKSKAVVVFVIDLTGSMSGRPQELAKEWVAYVDWLIRAFYQQVEVRFVGYSAHAEEFSRKKIFKAFLGSSTIDSTGFSLGEKILTDKQYSDTEWDKYLFGIGDGGSTDGPQTFPILDRLYKICSYMGWMHVTANGQGMDQFVGPIRERSEKLPWFGYGEIDDTPGAAIRSIPEFFKGEKK